MPFSGNQGFVEIFTFRPHVGGGRALYFEWAALILGQFNPFKSERHHLLSWSWSWSNCGIICVENN
jgi:hypothetical protein